MQKQSGRVIAYAMLYIPIFCCSGKLRAGFAWLSRKGMAGVLVCGWVLTYGWGCAILRSKHHMICCSAEKADKSEGPWNH